MSVLNPVGMNANGQFVIASNGDTFSVFATVANSGSYTDLTNQPTIPSGQVQTDWNASSGLGVLLDKPTVVSAFTNDTGYITASSLAPYVTGSSLSSTLSSYTTSSALTTALAGYVPTSRTVNGHALSSNVTVSASDVGAPAGSGNSTGTNTGDQVIPSVARTTSVLTLSLVGTGATGTQISSTKDSTVRCSVSTSTTSTIGGPSTSVVTLKICATNNATEGSWTSVATFESDQTITLAIALQSIQIVKGQLCADVPAGWYVKLVNSGTGTHAETFVSAQQTIYG